MIIATKIVVAAVAAVAFTYLEGLMVQKTLKQLPRLTAWQRQRKEDEQAVQAREDLVDAMLMSSTDKLLDEIGEALDDV